MYLGWKRRRVRQIGLSLLLYTLPIVIICRTVAPSVAGPILGFLLPVYMVFAMFSMFQAMTVDIVSEKESKMKEILHIHGVGGGSPSYVRQFFS